MIIRIAILILSLLPALSLWSTAAHAGLIRDAEIESTIRDYADPIFKEAGLKPSAIKIYIVNDDSLNAFVAGGAKLFIHTGLIMETKSPAMLLGVIAHETDHIAGGHLAKGGEKLKDAQLGTILTTVVGAAAAVATGKPEAGAAVITGAGSAVQRNMMSFSRANENSADQAALNYLDHLGISASGMVDVFSLLRRQERQHFGKPDPYIRTHPLTGERIEFVQNHVDKSPIPPGTYPKSLAEKHARMVAKLFAFIRSPELTLRTYSAGDNSVAARMARAIAFFQQAKMEQAAPIMDTLIKENPNDAYLYELQGQMMFESAHIEEAYAAYNKAAKLKPGEPLILSDLAKVELARNNPADTASAVGHLEHSLSIDKDNSGAWRLLATAYGRQNNNGMATLALAEESLLEGDPDEASILAMRALNTLPPNTPARQRADDLKQRAAQMKKEKKDAESMF